MGMLNPAYAFSPLAINQNFAACLDVLNGGLDDIFTQLENLNAGYLIDKSEAELEFYAQGIYGFVRPTIGLGVYIGESGAYGQRGFATRFCSFSPATIPDSKLLTDDEFLRFIIWHLYIDDGMQFSIKWLKLRLARFLLPSIFDRVITTYDISITLNTKSAIEITLPNSELAETLKWLIAADLLGLPYDYTYEVTLA